MAQKNMSVFKEAWAENVSLLTDSVDAISPLLEFMSTIGTAELLLINERKKIPTAH